MIKGKVVLTTCVKSCSVGAGSRWGQRGIERRRAVSGQAAAAEARAAQRPAALHGMGKTVV